MSNASDFIIENGVLKKYVGPGGDVVIPEGVTEIGVGAFNMCRRLNSVVIPETVKTIGLQAFRDCVGLKRITVPNSVTKIGEWAFTIAPYLEVIHYNAVSATFVGNDRYPFEHTGSRITINIGSDVTEIPAYMFANATLESVIFAEDSVCTKIGDGAFLGCYGLTTFTPPCGIVEIGAGAFDGCESVLVKYDNAT